MKKRLSFDYGKRERKGVLCLFLLVFFAMIWKCFSIADFFTTEKQGGCVVKQNSENLWIDSLQYTYNPNFIDDELGYRLGMSVKEIDRLLKYRSLNAWLYSPEEFQKITQISDSLLKVLSPKFRFPFKKEKQGLLLKNDLNEATDKELQKIYGVGPVLSSRIVRYRARLGGFSMKKQLNEVWGLKPDVVQRVFQKFEIKKAPTIQKQNINTARFKEVLSIVYLDYSQTVAIFRYKKKVGKIKSLQELKKIEGFPVEMYDRIVLYLQAQ